MTPRGNNFSYRFCINCIAKIIFTLNNIYFLLILINVNCIYLFIICTICYCIFCLALVQQMYIAHIPCNKSLPIIRKVLLIIIVRNFVFYNIKYILHNYILFRA